MLLRDPLDAVRRLGRGAVERDMGDAALGFERLVRVRVRVRVGVTVRVRVRARVRVRVRARVRVS